MSSTLAGVIVAVVYGLAVGSFTNVIIDRLPLALDEPNRFGELWDTRPWGEVLGGRSRCSTCATPIRVVDNIPVISYLVLRGRCRGCGERYPAFHLLVELMVPVLAGLAVWGIGLHAALIPTLWLIPTCVAIGLIDFRTMIVPTRLVWPTLVVSLAITAGIAIQRGDATLLLGGAIGVGVLAGPLFLVWWFIPRGMGFGDVRLAVLLGWNVGFVAWMTLDRPIGPVFLAVTTLAVGAVLGIVVGIALQVGLGRPIPFGPALVGGALFALILAHPILQPLV